MGGIAFAGNFSGFFAMKKVFAPDKTRGASDTSWSDRVVELAAHQVLAELPDVPSEVIVAAARRCGKEVSIDSGFRVLKQHIRRSVRPLPLVPSS